MFEGAAHEIAPSGHAQATRRGRQRVGSFSRRTHRPIRGATDNEDLAPELVEPMTRLIGSVDRVNGAGPVRRTSARRRDARGWGMGATQASPLPLRRASESDQWNVGLTERGSLTGTAPTTGSAATQGLTHPPSASLMM